jgi:hypothetical protein
MEPSFLPPYVRGREAGFLVDRCAIGTGELEPPPDVAVTGRWLLAGVALFGIPLLCVVSSAQEPRTRLENNEPIPNAGGHHATVSTHGSVDLTGEFFQAQGTNGRSCVSCHLPQDAWSITPGTLQRLFDETGGTAPVFNLLDANNPGMDVSTVAARRAAYSMLLSRGVFRRGGAPRTEQEWDPIAVDDPHGFASLTRLVHWRRAMPTINFALGSATINWDGGNSVGTDQRAGLVNQAARNVTGGQQGSPAPPEIINNVVDLESSLSTAQLTVPGGERDRAVE